MRVPKYQMIEDELRSQIESGEFEYGDRFYGEAELIEHYDVSSITVVRALRDLVNMGYLVRRQGKGTFVSRSRKRQLVEFTDKELFARHLDREQVRVVSCEKADDPEVRNALGLGLDEGYHEIVRVRSIDGVPFMASFSHIPSRYVKDDVPADYYASIYRRMREDFGLHPYDEAATEVNDIVLPAPAQVRELLGIDEATPCVRLHKQTRMDSGTMLEDAVGYKRWDYFRIEFETKGRGVRRR